MAEESYPFLNEEESFSVYWNYSPMSDKDVLPKFDVSFDTKKQAEDRVLQIKRTYQPKGPILIVRKRIIKEIVSGEEAEVS